MLIERRSTVTLVGLQEAVHLGDMHPLQQMRVIGPVGLPVRRNAVHPAVDTADPVYRALGVRGGAERGDGQESAGALKSSPGIAAIVGVLGHPRHRQWMQRLKQQGAQTADEHRGVGVHLPDGPVLGEPARPGRLVDTCSVPRPVRAGDHGEQPCAEAFPHPAEVQ